MYHSVRERDRETGSFHVRQVLSAQQSKVSKLLSLCLSQRTIRYAALCISLLKLLQQRTTNGVASPAEMYPFTALKTSLRRKCRRLVLSESRGRNLLQASPWVCRGLRAICGDPWLIDASPPSLPSSSHGVLPVCVSLPKTLLFRRTPLILDSGLPLRQQRNLVVAELINLR